MTLLGSLFFLRDFPAVPTMLTIAGSDSCGGAGIEADIKTATVLGVFSACCITAVTYQNTRGVAGLEMVSEFGLKEQLKAVCTDMTINAVKIGMTGSKETIKTIRDAIVVEKRGIGPCDGCEQRTEANEERRVRISEGVSNSGLYASYA